MVNDATCDPNYGVIKFLRECTNGAMDTFHYIKTGSNSDFTRFDVK